MVLGTASGSYIDLYSDSKLRIFEGVRTNITISAVFTMARKCTCTEEVILVAKPEIILVAKYSGGKTSLKYLITPPAHNQLYMCRGKKKNIFFVF